MMKNKMRVVMLVMMAMYHNLEDDDNGDNDFLLLKTDGDNDDLVKIPKEYET